MIAKKGQAPYNLVPMSDDPRKHTALYYDLVSHPVDDVPFYLNRVKMHAAQRLLELGCGTGRVFVNLAKVCPRAVGVDYSSEMLGRCREKLRSEGVSTAQLVRGDITQLNLNEQFDLVIAPYRVLQALESDDEVNGFFDTIERHLKPSGFGIVNTFRPNRSPEELRRDWIRATEMVCEEKTLEDGSRLVYADRRPRMDKVKLVLYPEMIYRKYRNNELIEEVIHPIKMRCYYADELVRLIFEKRFTVTECWGGYHNEAYGEGPELVVEFKKQ